MCPQLAHPHAGVFDEVAKVRARRRLAWGWHGADGMGLTAGTDFGLAAAGGLRAAAEHCRAGHRARARPQVRAVQRLVRVRRGAARRWRCRRAETDRFAAMNALITKGVAEQDLAVRPVAPFDCESILFGLLLLHLLHLHHLH